MIQFKKGLKSPFFCTYNGLAANNRLLQSTFGHKLIRVLHIPSEIGLIMKTHNAMGVLVPVFILDLESSVPSPPRKMEGNLQNCGFKFCIHVSDE